MTSETFMGMKMCLLGCDAILSTVTNISEKRVASIFIYSEDRRNTLSQNVGNHL